MLRDAPGRVASQSTADPIFNIRLWHDPGERALFFQWSCLRRTRHPYRRSTGVRPYRGAAGRGEWRGVGAGHFRLGNQGISWLSTATNSCRSRWLCSWQQCCLLAAAIPPQRIDSRAHRVTSACRVRWMQHFQAPVRGTLSKVALPSADVGTGRARRAWDRRAFSRWPSGAGRTITVGDLLISAPVLI